MPMPIAHSATGLAGYFTFKKNNLDRLQKQELLLLGLSIFLANLPDLDFMIGFLCGEPGKFHHGASHSIVLCLAIALICYKFVKNKLRGISKNRILGCCLLSLLSHPILDYFSKDTSEPFGVPLLWPFDGEYYISSLPMFPDVRRIDDTVRSFFPSLMNAHNGWGLVVEILFAGTLLCAIFGFKTRAKKVRYPYCFLISALCGALYYLIQIRPNLF